MAFLAIFSTFFVIVTRTSTSSSSPTPSTNHNLITAIQEMQKANYFTFVTLINMSPIHPNFENVTFLMPNDRKLSETTISGDAVAGFLRRHAVPSPLLFDHLLHIPTGSVLPSLEPGFSFSLSNQGRRNFSVNNVKIISPNICVAGFSVRCHGVDGVMQDAAVQVGGSNGNCSCAGGVSCYKADPGGSSTASVPPLPPASGIVDGMNAPPAVAAPPPDFMEAVNRKSGSSGGFSCWGSLELVGMLSSIMLLL